MKHYTSALVVFLIFIIKVNGQKPALDTAVFREWPSIEGGQISSDGKYISYKIAYKSYWRVRRKELVIQAVSGKWKKILPNATSDLTFSLDGKKAVVRLSRDSVAVFEIGSDKVDYIQHVTRYQANPEYIFYIVAGDAENLHVTQISNNSHFLIDKVNDYLFDKEQNRLVLTKKGNDGTSILSCYDLKHKSSTEFWEGLDVDNITLDHRLGQVAFTGKQNGMSGVWLYSPVRKDVQLILKEHSLEIDSLLMLKGIGGFSPDDKKLFLVFGMKNTPAFKQADSTGATVTIWNYADTRLKSEQDNGRSSTEIQYVVNLISRKVIPITARNELLLDYAGDFGITQQYSGKGDPDDEYWNPRSQNKMFLISLIDGHKVELPMKNPMFSRGGKYLLYYENDSKDYCTYETSSGKVTNVTLRISQFNKVPSHKYAHEFMESNGYRSYWFDNDSAFILYAERDIWKIDPQGLKEPVNLTNGYGARTDIAFYPVENLEKFSFQNGKQLVLMGYNYTNKDNGFYRIKLGDKKGPQKLVMNAYSYYMPYLPIENGFDTRPIKAKDANLWLVKKMSEKEFPNLFVTKDFKVFAPVTAIYPEKRFNWMTTELHTWQSFDRSTVQGILYKPEDFDSHKKYPIIFHYYDQWSRNLHAYLNPGPSIGPINIPWYVSQGYLVFVPDVIFKVGETGKSAYNSIVSAAMYMKTKDYVDSTKMAIQGHSFGGYETNYIITQTDIFAAACSSSGVTDIVSFAGGLGASGKSNHLMASNGQLGMGEILWSNPERFIKNSPLFSLNKVTTPLLAMHTTDDRAVPFSQAMELFNGLRQFKKRVWLLVYEGENHVLRSERNSLDYTLRQTAFFNYYLKNTEMPSWMKANNN
ncbi:prolyl oligopeptidase family serine peptidase [Chitinophaga sp.]|uniref:alpha/beta hydrolase family protein n=1 Tax=Chitinophaga sp. TaxID=1869181 RepID=UPI0031DE83FA